MNRENLSRLADYLAALPADYEHFDMARFRTTMTGKEHEPTTRPMGCRTVACAVGHAPLALPDLPPKPDEEWDEYSNRLFGLYDREWEWCFAAGWVHTDNTPAGAAARIRWLLEHGLPGDAYEQRQRRAPLCYRAEVGA